MYNRLNPLQATIKERTLLNKPGSTKETYHISLDLKNTQFPFQVGDSLAVLPQNDPKNVNKILEVLRSSGEEIVFDTRKNEELSLKKFLSDRANLAKINTTTLQILEEHCLDPDQKKTLTSLLHPDNKTQLLEFIKEKDLLDFCATLDLAPIAPSAFFPTLSPMLPRFYSIASSQQAHPNEIHLTVALFTFTQSGEKKFGVASHFLCKLSEEGKTPIPIYIQKNHGFTLPESDELPIIMVGPGTGIAPFRAFLQERVHRAAPGKNWLFFGERQKEFDFFYQDFFHDLTQKQKLRLDAAFSRDQEHKVYVQHKMYENKKEIWSWLQEGALLYVCGDASRMAKDVEAILHKIIQEEGNLSEEHASSYLKTLRKQKKYLLDVY